MSNSEQSQKSGLVAAFIGLRDEIDRFISYETHSEKALSVVRYQYELAVQGIKVVEHVASDHDDAISLGAEGSSHVFIWDEDEQTALVKNLQERIEVLEADTSLSHIIVSC